MNKKLLNLLGLATRSGNVISGEEMVVGNIKKAKICFLASDAGPNTTKKITNKCLFYGVDLVTTFSREELSIAIGKNRVCLIVKDQGFSNKMKEIIKEGENYD